MSAFSQTTGDHVICGSYDCRLSWFDLDLSTKPYKVLRYKQQLSFRNLPSSTMSYLTNNHIVVNICLCRHHKKAVRGVAYHRLYPLFASGSDDGSVIVCHGTVYK